MVDPIQAVEDRAEQRIMEAEYAKAHMYDIPGRPCSTEIDESFVLIRSLLDESITEKSNKENMLILSLEDDKRMELIHELGKGAFYVPAADRDLTAISSIHRWTKRSGYFQKFILVII